MRVDRRILLACFFAALGLLGCKKRKATNVARAWLSETGVCVQVEGAPKGADILCPLSTATPPAVPPPPNGDCAISDGRNVKCGDLTPQMLDVPIRAASIGGRHACAVGENGEVWCWGENRSGQLGDGTKTSHSKAMKVALEGVAEAALGDDFSCARLLSGTVACWGANGEAQLGDGSGAGSLVPRAVFGLMGVDQITARGATACSVGHDKGLKCWGKRWDSVASPYTVPTPIPIRQ